VPRTSTKAGAAGSIAGSFSLEIRACPRRTAIYAPSSEGLSARSFLRHPHPFRRPGRWPARAGRAIISAGLVDRFDPDGHSSWKVEAMTRPLAVTLVMGLIVIAVFDAIASAKGVGQTHDFVLGPLALAFQPPGEFRDDFGSYKSPLTFNDGRPVRD